MPAAETGALSDADLVAELGAGSEEAFRSLVAAHDGLLRRMARTYVEQRDVEDVVQETWVRVIRGIGGFEGRSTLRTWICGILINVARRVAQREGRTIPFAPTMDATQRSGTTTDLDRLGHPELGGGYWPAPPSWARDPELSHGHLPPRPAAWLVTRLNRYHQPSAK